MYFPLFYWVCMLIIVNTSLLCLAPCTDCQCAWLTANSAVLLQCLTFTFPSCRKWSTLYFSVHWSSIPARGLLCLKMPRLYLSVLLIRQKLEIVVVMWCTMPDAIRSGVLVLWSAVQYSVKMWCHIIALELWYVQICHWKGCLWKS